MLRSELSAEVKGWDLITHDIMQKPNSITVLLKNFLKQSAKVDFL